MSIVSATKTNLVRDKTKKDTHMCSVLLKQLEREEIRTDCPLQRSPSQWDKESKDGLIVTAILHEDIDSIKMCEQIRNGNIVVWIIDGVQRMTTLSEFRHSAFKLGKNIEHPIVYYQVKTVDAMGNTCRDENGNIIYELVEYDLRDKTYKDLPEELQESFDSFSIDTIKHLDCSDEEVGYHIRRYNRQTSMNVSQSSITYMDKFARDAKRIARGKFFKRECYRESERRKNIIERLVTESIMATYHLDQWKKSSKQAGRFLNQFSNVNEFQQLESNINRLDRIVDDTTEKVFNAKNSFVWFAVFNNFIQMNIADHCFNDFLHEFINHLHNKKLKAFDNQSFDTLDACRSTKDKRVVVAKIGVLAQLMKDYFHDEIDHHSENLSDFIKNYVDGAACGVDDIELYETSLDDYIVEVDNQSPLLQPQNHTSLIGIVAYAFTHDIDQYLGTWMATYFHTHDTYDPDQGQNYKNMQKNFHEYIRCKTVCK